MASGSIDGIQVEDIIYLAEVINGNNPESALTSLYQSCGWIPECDWQKPVTEFGDSLPEWKTHVLHYMRYIGQFEIDNDAFIRAGRYTNAVLALIYKAMKKNASTYHGLVLDGYRFQGSSRDGLKVISPDEFDTMLIFHFDDLRCVEETIEKNGRDIAGFCNIRIPGISVKEKLQNGYQELFQREIFQFRAGNAYLSSRKLHQGIFESLVDKSLADIRDISRFVPELANCIPQITRKMNPPSVNIVIEAKGLSDKMYPKEIGIDIVPALLLNTEYKRCPDGSIMPFPIYAVCKWTEKQSVKAFDFVDSERIWHISKVSYESYLFDIARQNPRQRCVMTSVRLLKTYLTKCRRSRIDTPQVVNILKSYHLKQIGLYLLLFLCYKKPDLSLHGTEDMVRYMFTFMDNVLKVGCLPHFFHSQTDINCIFPNQEVGQESLSYDLFGGLDPETIKQARNSWNNRVAIDFLFVQGVSDLDIMIISSAFQRKLLEEAFFS